MEMAYSPLPQPVSPPREKEMHLSLGGQAFAPLIASCQLFSRRTRQLHLTCLSSTIQTRRSPGANCSRPD